MPKKPNPLFVDGRWRYTLASYDPVKITVNVPFVSPADVSYGLAGVLRESGWAGQGLPSDEWVAKNVPGVNTMEELRDAIRTQLTAMNERFAGESKRSLCTSALARRLEQSVPEAEVARVRDSLLHGLEEQTRQAGLKLADALRGMGVSDDSLGTMLDEQARTEAEGEAALDALVDEYALYADETELPGLLGLSPREARTLIDEARRSGNFNDLMRHALRQKAAAIVVSECSCTYVHETAEEAAERMAAVRERRESWTMPEDGPSSGANRPGSKPDRPDSRSHLKLV